MSIPPFYTVNFNDWTINSYTGVFSTEWVRGETNFQTANFLWKKIKYRIEGVHYSYETPDKKYLFAVGLPMYTKFWIIFRTGGNSLYIVNQANLEVKQIFLKDKESVLRIVWVIKTKEAREKY